MGLSGGFYFLFFFFFFSTFFDAARFWNLGRCKLSKKWDTIVYCNILSLRVTKVRRNVLYCTVLYYTTIKHSKTLERTTVLTVQTSLYRYIPPHTALIPYILGVPSPTAYQYSSTLNPSVQFPAHQNPIIFHSTPLFPCFILHTSSPSQAPHSSAPDTCLPTNPLFLPVILSHNLKPQHQC